MHRENEVALFLNQTGRSVDDVVNERLNVGVNLVRRRDDRTRIDPLDAAVSLRRRGERAGKARVIQEAIILDTLNAEGIGEVREPIQVLGRRLIDLRNIVQLRRARAIDFKLAVLFHDLKEKVLALRIVQIDAGSAVLGEVAVSRSLARGLNHVEHRRRIFPVAHLPFAGNLGDLDGGEGVANDFRVDVRGKPNGNARRGGRANGGHGVHRKREVPLHVGRHVRERFGHNEAVLRMDRRVLRPSLNGVADIERHNREAPSGCAPHGGSAGKAALHSAADWTCQRPGYGVERRS